MTWGMFAIGMLEVGSKLRADEFFSKYKENVQPPFNVSNCDYPCMKSDESYRVTTYKLAN